MTPGIEPGPLIALLYVSSGVALTGVVQGIAMLLIINPRSRNFWLYTALSALVACFQIEVVRYHMASSLEAAIAAQKWLNCAAFIFLPLLFAFIADHTGQSRIKPWLWIVSGLSAILAIVNFLMPFGIRFGHTVSSSSLEFSWGEQLQTLYGEQSSISFLAYALFFGVFAWGMLRAADLFRKGDRLSGAFIGIGLLAMIMGTVATRLVDLGVFQFIYLGGFGFLVFVIFMAVLVSSRLHHATKQIEHLAFRDTLTGLPNRSGLLTHLDHVLSHAQETGGEFAILLININRFDIVNDTLGHSIGDELLVQVAQRLQSQTGDSGLVARMGADEFVVVVTDSTSSIGLFVEKLQQTMHAPFEVDDHSLNITLRIGIATSPGHGDSAIALLMNADLAARDAKHRGHSQMEFFRPEMQMAIQERHQIGNDLRTALLERQFELHYQPQISAIDGRVICVEALIRWNHPEDGRIPPQRFIPVAEETQMMVSIGAWVIEEACRNLAAWRQNGINDVRVAINLSVQQLLHSDLHALVTAMLAQHGLKGDDLEFEITESAMMQDTEKSIAQLRLLRNLGIKVSIDDFGTGYSSLSYLKLLPIDALKIDRSFVTDIVQDANDAMICSVAVTMARSLHIVTVAEGVETEEQAIVVRNLGYDLLQGNLYAKPLPAAVAETFIRERNGIGLRAAIT